jgi:hypothetical protein
VIPVSTSNGTSERGGGAEMLTWYSARLAMASRGLNCLVGTPSGSSTAAAVSFWACVARKAGQMMGQIWCDRKKSARREQSSAASMRLFHRRHRSPREDYAATVCARGPHRSCGMTPVPHGARQPETTDYQPTTAPPPLLPQTTHALLV